MMTIMKTILHSYKLSLFYQKFGGRSVVIHLLYTCVKFVPKILLHFDYIISFRYHFLLS